MIVLNLVMKNNKIYVLNGKDVWTSFENSSVDAVKDWLQRNLLNVLVV